MSQAAKQSLIVLIVLLMGSLGFGFYTMLEKQKVEKERAGLQQEVQQYADREKKNILELKDLKDKLAQSEAKNNDLQAKLKKAEKSAEDLLTQATQLTEDRNQWKEKVETITKNRDDLLAKISNLTTQLETAKAQAAEAKPARPVVLAAESQPSGSSGESTAVSPSVSQTMKEITPVGNSQEDQWATILKEKAALQVQIENLKSELNKNSVEVVEFKQKNDSLQLELDSLKHDKEELDREIKFQEDLVNNLSLELARTKNDKKFVSDRVAKLNEENAELRSQLKQLVTTKSALEKTIVRISDDKGKIEKKLNETENLVQSKIDEIWEVKDSLDKTVKFVKEEPSLSSEIELPPIVVSSSSSPESPEKGSAPGFNGKVVSLNEENNFIIVDLGESSGVQLGDILSVYRDSKYIARVEVIQVRKDISAADIKDQWAKIKVGDTIK